MKPRGLGLIAAALAAGSLLAAPALAEDSRTGSAGTGAAGQGSTGPGLAPQIDDMMHPTHRPERLDGTDSGRPGPIHEGSAGDAPGAGDSGGDGNGGSGS